MGPVMLVSPWVPLSSGVGSASCNRLARLPGFVHAAIGSALSGSAPQYIGSVWPLSAPSALHEHTFRNGPRSAVALSN